MSSASQLEGLEVGDSLDRSLQRILMVNDRGHRTG